MNPERLAGVLMGVKAHWLPAAFLGILLAGCAADPEAKANYARGAHQVMTDLTTATKKYAADLALAAKSPESAKLTEQAEKDFGSALTTARDEAAKLKPVAEQAMAQVNLQLALEGAQKAADQVHAEVVKGTPAARNTASSALDGLSRLLQQLSQKVSPGA